MQFAEITPLMIGGTHSTNYFALSWYPQNITAEPVHDSHKIYKSMLYVKISYMSVPYLIWLSDSIATDICDDSVPACLILAYDKPL
jgi:hypothetical protein